MTGLRPRSLTEYAGLLWRKKLLILLTTTVVLLATWIVIGYFAVVRFLSYLDLRIRSEGWEVELAMRAEGSRIARQLA